MWTYADLLAASEVPRADNRTLFGDTNSQTLDGQGIAEVLVGGDGGDSFIFNRGYGNVRVEEHDASSSTNSLVLGTGLTPANVQASYNGTDVTLTFPGDGTAAQDAVTLEAQLDTSPVGTISGVQKILFGDGTIWTRSDLLNALGLGGGSSSHEAAPPANALDAGTATAPAIGPVSAPDGAYSMAPVRSRVSKQDLLRNEAQTDPFNRVASAPSKASELALRSAAMMVEASAAFDRSSAFEPTTADRGLGDNGVFGYLASHKSTIASLAA